MNRELSTYKERLALELTNFKKAVRDTEPHQGQVCQTKPKVGVWPWTLTPDSDPDRNSKCTDNKLTSWGCRFSSSRWPHAHCCPRLPLLPDVTLPPLPPLDHFGQTLSASAGGLVEAMDVLYIGPWPSQYVILQETLRQSLSALKEQSSDGKNPQEFGMWLDEVSWLATICNKNPIEVTLAISRGNLHKYISKLVSNRLSWLPIKAHLKERFLGVW